MDESWYDGGEVAVNKEFPNFEVRCAGLMSFVLRRDRLEAGNVAVRPVGAPTFYRARAEADLIILEARREELWRQVEELKAQAASEADQQKAFRLAERMEDLLGRLTALGTTRDKWRTR